ncbi:IclR family transcriptional regulator [Aliibacillus thermotolerans]|uniref:IclR family transcriptional regulator n=1 Tax=Aliibacillus thermotolerans TaxID=1834418 RepID=A0ABW0U5A5_9BACI|nr:IclR family transcriptional regulator [Aliibacillus thermotolerans]MDA3129041.1 helix-turn-helix domain-containing protein [Aliibacillus thermotolerans]
MVKSVDRALTIIKIVSTKKEGYGVTELAEKLGLNKSSIFRLLATLMEHGFIEQDSETKKYRLGYQYLELSAKLLDSIDIRKEATPYLKELESLSNEVIHLVIYSQKEAVYIEKLEGNETLRMHSQVGKIAPMHCTSAGKTILAYLPERTVEEIIDEKGLPKHTENTITNREALFQDLEKIRKRGYGKEVEENEVGITCIAAPIFNFRGEIAGSISISGPTIRMSEERLEELKGPLMEAGRKVSLRLGFRNGNHLSPHQS